MDTTTHQLSLFQLGTEDSKPTLDERRLIARLITLRDERRVVVAALERLRPEEEYWRKQKEEWRGVVNFKYPANKFSALEARGNVRFLENAEQRIRNLSYEIETIEAQLGISE